MSGCLEQVSQADYNQMHERAKVFIDHFGGWNPIDYICWTSAGKRAYLRSIGKSDRDLIVNHDEFTEFLRRWKISDSNEFRPTSAKNTGVLQDQEMSN